MKNIINTITKGTVFMALFAVGTVGVFAATLNTDPSDFATLRVKNETDYPGTTTNWATYASADAGETVSFAIYYHNTSNETAHNVRVRLSPQNTGTGTTHSFTAYVWADNASQISGGATVNLSGSESLSYITSSVVWRPNQTVYGFQTLPGGQNGSEIFSSNGLSLGDIAPGWSTQGSVVLKFRVSGSGGYGNYPIVNTNSATNISQNNATLNCNVDPQGTTDTRRWFEWGATSSFGNQTPSNYHGNSAGSFNYSISGLYNNTTYYFRCVAENSTGRTNGSTMTFYTGGGYGQLPSVTTYQASGVTGSYAVLEGYVDPKGTSNTTRWFEWGTTSWNLNNNTSRIGQGSSSGTFSDTITGLSSDTTYYYRAVAQNDYGRVEGGIQSFTTTYGGQQRPFVSTSNATNVLQNSATLNGYVNPYNTWGTSRWFEWGTTQGLGNRTNTLSHGNTASNFSETITGLYNNTTYYYRAVAQNSYGTNYGNTVSFTTGTGVVDNNPPTAITNLATNIDQDSARLNALAIITGNVNSTGWYEWGTTQSLGFTTATQNLGSLPSVAFKQSMFGLNPNTTYYYRAVVQNTNGTSRGSILNFRTNSRYVPPPAPGPVKEREVSIIKELENLTSPNGTRTRVEALRGDIVRFNIEVENTGDYTLEDVEIKDLIPHYLEFANAEEENIDALQREVVWFVGDMRPGEREEVSLDVIVTGDARIGSIIENVARVESVRLTRTSNEVEIEVTDRISTLAATVFLGGVFLPDTLIEWLLLIVLILIIVIASRKVYGLYEEKKKESVKK